MKEKIKYIRDGRAPIPKKETISRVMSANRAKGTKPELILRKALRIAGISGSRSHLPNIPGRPDAVFPKEHLAIFVHGCFWHRCSYCKDPLPKTHRSFWKKKFLANKLRDKKKNAELRKLGWRVLTVWECQIKRDAVVVAERIKRSLALR